MTQLNKNDKNDKDLTWDVRLIEERIDYHTQQIASSNRLDGWSLKGHKKELGKLKEDLKELKNKR